MTMFAPSKSVAAAAVCAADCRLYRRPQLQTAHCALCAGAFKETAPPPRIPNGAWKPAQPGDQVLRGKWWELFDEPELNALEEKIEVSNQTLKAATEQYFSARSAVQIARASYFPTLGAGPCGLAPASVGKPAQRRAWRITNTTTSRLLDGQLGT